MTLGVFKQIKIINVNKKKFSMSFFLTVDEAIYILQIKIVWHFVRFNFSISFSDVPEDVLKGYKYEAAGTINNTGL